MKNVLLSSFLALGLVGMFTVPSLGDWVVVGTVQVPQGEAADWSPTTSTLIMSEAGGVYTQSLTNLTDTTPIYEFKVLDDEGTPPADWGDPEIVPYNVRVYGGGSGDATITLDSNTPNANGSPTLWVNSDTYVLQVVGSFQVAAGGAADWNPADSAFLLTSQGNGYYSYDAVIATPGTYEFKFSMGDGWDNQVGTDGFSNNAASASFTTTTADEAVTFFVDLANNSIGPITESPVVLGDVNLDGFVDFLDISPFITVLSTGGSQAEADIDESGTVDFLDITPFIAILSGQ
jgi:hypothetical protein